MAFVEREKSEKSKARRPKMPGTFLTWEFQDYFFQRCLMVFGCVEHDSLPLLCSFTKCRTFHQHCDDTSGCGISISLRFKSLFTDRYHTGLLNLNIIPESSVPEVM